MEHLKDNHAWALNRSLSKINPGYRKDDYEKADAVMSKFFELLIHHCGTNHTPCKVSKLGLFKLIPVRASSTEKAFVLNHDPSIYVKPTINGIELTTYQMEYVPSETMLMKTQTLVNNNEKIEYGFIKQSYNN